MKTNNITDNCLTYEQLQSYSLKKNDSEENEQLNAHISTCELCSAAVMGFTAIPFTIAEINAIHQKIDIESRSIKNTPLNVSNYIIIAISIITIFGFYKFTDVVNIANVETQIAKKKTIVETKPIEKTIINIAENKTNFQLNTLNTKRKNSLIISIKRNATPAEYIENKPVLFIKTKNEISEKETLPLTNFNEIYIDHLKIVDYQKLYYKTATENYVLNNYTPSPNENKESTPFIENELEQHTSLPSILKKGLYYFNKDKFHKANEQFLLLLENNPNDLNALFYSGIAFYQQNKNENAIQQLKLVLKNSNTSFYPEAKWYLALAYLKTNAEIGNQLLKEIVDENGFYVNQAREILNTKQP
jgi:hypothetical protein